MCKNLISLAEFKRKKIRQYIRSNKSNFESFFREFQTSNSFLNISNLCLSSCSYSSQNYQVSDDYLSFREKLEDIISSQLGPTLFRTAKELSWFDPILCTYDDLLDSYISFLILNLPDQIMVK